MDSSDLKRFFPGGRNSPERQYIRQETEQLRNAEEHEVLFLLCIPLYTKKKFPTVEILALLGSSAYICSDIQISPLLAFIRNRLVG